MKIVEKIKHGCGSLYRFVARNKYLAATLVFIIILVFLDSNNIFNRFRQDQEIKELKKEIEVFKKQISEGEELLKALHDDSLQNEHMAREKYHMRRSGEDVFIEP